MVERRRGATSSDDSGPSSPQNRGSPPPPMEADLLSDLISSLTERDGTRPKKKKLVQKELEEKNKIISEKDQIISDLTTELEKKEGEVCARDNLLKQKDAKLEKKEGEVCARDNLLKEKDAELEKKEGEVCTRDNLLKEKDAELEKKEGEVCTRDNLLKEKDAKLEKKEGEVCARDNLLKEKDAELTNCRKNLDHCETEKRELEGKLRRYETDKRELEEKHWASQGRIRCENEQLKMELARCDAWNQQQGNTIYYLNAQLGDYAGCYNQLLFQYKEQSASLESFDRLVHERQRELADAGRRIQALTDKLSILEKQSIDVTQNNGTQQDVDGDVAINTNSRVIPNGNADNATSFVSSGNASTPATLEVSQISASSQTVQDLTKLDAEDEHDMSVDGQALPSGNTDVHTSLEIEPVSVISPSTEGEQVLSRENGANTVSIQVGTITVPLEREQ